MANLAYGLLLVLASSSLADAGTCAGDSTGDVYRGMNCAQILASYSEGTFCNNPNIWKDECCASWAEICEKFKCKNGDKVPIDKICDKKDDCSDGSDEDVCYQCHNGDLLSNNKLCSGKAECTDGSDEGEGVCITCGDNQRYGYYYTCDGRDQCPGNSDEQDCRGEDLPGDYVVELLVIVDYYSQKPYLLENKNNKADAEKSILKDIDYFLTEINKHYANFFNSDFKMRVSKRAVILLGENEDIFKSGKLPANEEGRPRVDSNLAMTLMRDYLRDTNAYAKYKYDHAAFFTGYDIGYPDRNKWTVIGKAFMSQTCETQGSALSVTEWTGDYQSVGVAAHEIAHNLGSQHDPETVLGYIMSPVSANTDERWWFSTLSTRNISNYMRKLNKMGNNCLLKANSAAGYDIPNAEITESLSDPNVLCERAHGPNWIYHPNPQRYTGEGNPKGDFLCNTITCLDKSRWQEGWWNTAYTSDGMACDKNKVCDEGKCKASTSAVAMKATNAECLFGDAKLDGYCEDLATNDLPGLCNSEKNKKLCCASAATHCNKGPDYCYGDEKKPWSTYTCQSFIDERGTGNFCWNGHLFEKSCCASWAKHCTENSERSLVRRLIDALDKDLHGQHKKHLVKLEPEKKEKTIARELKVKNVKTNVRIDDLGEDVQPEVREATPATVVIVDPNIDEEVEPPVDTDTEDRKRFSEDFRRVNKRRLPAKRQGTAAPLKVVEVDKNIQEEIEPPVEIDTEERAVL